MVQFFDEQDEAPLDIRGFELPWLANMLLSVAVAASMFGYTAQIIGRGAAAFVNIALFGRSGV